MRIVCGHTGVAVIGGALGPSAFWMAFTIAAGIAMILLSPAPLVPLTEAGGGWGDPFTRDLEKGLHDVRDGYVSLTSARNDHGLEINEKTLTVDTIATSALRKAGVAS